MRFMNGWSWEDFLAAPQELVDEIYDILEEAD